jgi:hypothetical protein
MPWLLSRFRTGGLVEVRSQEEILATLDQHGCMDGIPFMPEMLQFCGQRFRVSAVAHKTCETARQTWKARRLQATVHLVGLRCGGSAHGGCQAECNLFWKDVWLKPADDKRGDSVEPSVDASPALGGCTTSQLLAHTRLALVAEEEEPRYSCQATTLYEATEPLAWWDVRQYVYDVITRNHSLGHVLRVLWLAFLKHSFQRMPLGYRLIKSFREQMHRWLTDREVPDFQGSIVRGEPTPTGRLSLQPGERVRIKSKEEIVKTLDETGKNRGLSFDAEMALYCGRIVTVRRSVTQIIDELAGNMRHMKQPCIMLEGIVCRSEYSECRLMCPRAIPSYWREIWLERIEDNQRSHDEPSLLEGVEANAGGAA